MLFFLPVVFFFLGTVLIIKGGSIFIDAACWTSEVTGISKAVIGATIVSLATTSPEYFVSLIATLKGYNDLSIGNAVGSLSANLGIAFGLLAIFAPGATTDRLFGVKGVIMIVSTVTLLLFCSDATVTVVEGIILLLLFVLSTFVNIRYSKDAAEYIEYKQTNSRDTAVNVAKFICGAGAIILGSNLIVDNGQIIATRLGVSEAVIGLTFVAIGTSLPEIVTSIAAIVKKQNALSIGNIIGANILDSTLILSTGAFISGGNLKVSLSTIKVDLPMALLLMIIAVLPTAIGRRIYRWQGGLMFGVYALYLLYITFR